MGRHSKKRKACIENGQKGVEAAAERWEQLLFDARAASHRRPLLIVRGVQQFKINEEDYLAGRKVALESSTQREGRLRLGGGGGVGCDDRGGSCDGGR